MPLFALPVLSERRYLIPYCDWRIWLPLLTKCSYVIRISKAFTTWYLMFHIYHRHSYVYKWEHGTSCCKESCLLLGFFEDSRAQRKWKLFVVKKMVNTQNQQPMLCTKNFISHLNWRHILCSCGYFDNFNFLIWDIWDEHLLMHSINNLLCL